MVAREFTVKVVGVSFRPGYPGNVNGLEFRHVRYGLGRGPKPVVEVRHDVQNEDPTAVGVWIDGEHFGYLPRTLAAKLCPELQAGARWTAEVAEVFGSTDPLEPEYGRNAGVSIRARRVAGPVAAPGEYVAPSRGMGAADFTTPGDQHGNAQGRETRPLHHRRERHR